MQAAAQLGAPIASRAHATQPRPPLDLARTPGDITIVLVAVGRTTDAVTNILRQDIRSAEQAADAGWIYSPARMLPETDDLVHVYRYRHTSPGQIAALTSIGPRRRITGSEHRRSAPGSTAARSAPTAPADDDARRLRRRARPGRAVQRPRQYGLSFGVTGSGRRAAHPVRSGSSLSSRAAHPQLPAGDSSGVLPLISGQPRYRCPALCQRTKQRGAGGAIARRIARG